jgi:uncharacterized protein YdeI (YjbR/CyaY-like superfamily)
MNPKVDFYFNKAKKWQQELKKLRTVVLGCRLTEELKWGKPCYTLEGKNVALIVAFKDYCALLLPKGALLKDPKRILVTPGQMQSTRQIRFAMWRTSSGWNPS